MVHLLYAVAAFTCALVVLILPIRTRWSLSKDIPTDRAFLSLVDWTAIFCIADSVWGVCASNLVMNDAMLMFTSFVFHLFAAFTPIVWLYFVLTYSHSYKYNRLYYILSVGLFLGELVLLLMNFKYRNVFTVDQDGAYSSGVLRQLLFYAQYINYVLIAIVALCNIFFKRKTNKSTYRAILAFVSSPIAAGIFQQLYPDAPAYSIGYMIGFCIIFSFVITDMLEARALEAVHMSNANKAKTTFLNNMSHDIRTPLNAITGFNTMALSALGKDDAKVRDCLMKTGQASNALLTIINDILEISRIESGKVSLSEDKISVMHSFAGIESMLQELARTADISLEFSFGQIDDNYVICDSAHCCRVFTNLITNAIKYTLKGGQVQVHCQQTGRRDDGYGIYTYTFKDNGIGMSEEFQKQLFQAFSRERTSTVSKIQGTGLGLALSKNLVELMGGTIKCVSRQGVGSTFTVVLPFRIQEGQECDQTNDNACVPEVVLDGCNILLVEDNALNREIAVAILSEMGADITEAADGSEAVEIMKSPKAGNIDLVLMDIQMPMVDGYEATRQIRALGTPASRKPIIAMTANAFEEDRLKALEAGMDGHVAKPIDIAALAATLQKFLPHNV